jgi:HlyD family secretion protein/macrolide-specific efflux system membrane fusion protein
MKKKIIIALLLVTAAGGFLWWRATQQPAEIKVLATAGVQRGTVRKVLEETGIVKAQVGAIVKIGARATGTIDRMLVKVGDPVTEGQLVAVIDRRELRAQEAEAAARLASARTELDRVRQVYPLRIAQAEAELAQAEAQADYLRGSAGRLEALFADKFVSRDEAENVRQQAEAQTRQVAARRANLEREQREAAEEQKKAELAVRQAGAALESIRVRISYTNIHSPIGGVVSQVTAQEGETIVAGLQVANLITVLDPQRLEMWVYVDETDIGQVHPRQKVEFKVDAYPGRIFEGEVLTIYPQPEIRDNIVYYQALVGISPEQATLLRPEMTTQVQIIVAEKSDVLLIPNNALKWVDNQQMVFVQTPDGVVRRVTPKLGLAGVTHSEVAEGLAEGEKVATQVELPGAKAGKEKGKP